MNEKELVIKAVDLARKQGVLFSESSPSFRPDDNPSRFHISIQINTTENSDGHASIDEHFDVLAQHTEISLANYFIRVFNKYNIERQASEIPA